MNKQKERSPYETILALCIALVLIYLIFDRRWAILASAGLGLAGLLSATLAQWIHLLWLRITHFLGIIMTHILLASIFYIFLWPISLLYRLAGKGSMKKSTGEKSNFVERKHSYSAKDMENMW